MSRPYGNSSPTAVNPFEEAKFSNNITNTYAATHIQLGAMGAGGNRTPSPTPSEAAELKRGVFNWKAMSSWRFWIRREWLWYYVALVLVGVVSALLYLYHKQLVHWLTPPAEFLKDLPFGWTIPIAVLFVLSFPPLFGHEIVAIICGLVWGLWIGFAIVAAGSLIGEIGNFYAFKWCCRARGEKLEKTDLSYACLAKVVRDGGFRIALVVRLSAVPGHFTTAVFSTCGMGIIVFTLAALLSMPKQFLTVYLGVVLEGSAEKAQIKDKIINSVVIGLTVLVTVAAMWYIFDQMNKVKPTVIYEKRKARQAKLHRASLATHHDITSTTNLVFNPNSAEAPYNQQWNKNGQAIGYAPSQQPAMVHAPQPRRASAPLESADSLYPGDRGYQRRQHNAGNAENYGRRNNESQESLGGDYLPRMPPPGVSQGPTLSVPGAGTPYERSTPAYGQIEAPPSPSHNGQPPLSGHAQEETWATYHTARSGSPEDLPPSYNQNRPSPV